MLRSMVAASLRTVLSRLNRIVGRRGVSICFGVIAAIAALVSVPEAAPTPLQKHYVLLSVPVLILGAIAITALEIGVPLGSPLVKLCVLIAAPLLVITTADAVVRIWRSAWAWMPVDRTKGLFRIAWVVTSLVGLAGLIAAALAALAA